MTTREEMLAVLKHEVIPALREIGFKGSLPHLHRAFENEHVDLVTFQFASGGGSFVIEIGYADPGRENVYIYKDAPPQKCESRKPLCVEDSALKMKARTIGSLTTVSVHLG